MFRNAHFKNLPMSDAVKITLTERVINDLTSVYVDDLQQDVMSMTTKDWLLFLLLPIKVLFMPLTSYLEQKDVKRLNKEDCALRFTTYSHFILYWRSFDDFETRPYRWNEI